MCQLTCTDSKLHKKAQSWSFITYSTKGLYTKRAICRNGLSENTVTHQWNWNQWNCLPTLAWNGQGLYCTQEERGWCQMYAASMPGVRYQFQSRIGIREKGDYYCLTIGINLVLLSTIVAQHPSTCLFTQHVHNYFKPPHRTYKTNIYILRINQVLLLTWCNNQM